MKHIYILYTGGTIGMERGKKGSLVPSRKFLKKIIDQLKIDEHYKIKHTFEALNPLLDSSNMKQENWIIMANHIKKNYNKYDGFVIIHGTDTMAYTSSTLSFLIQNISKPIVITGSQLPIINFRTDGINNLVNSIKVATLNIPEVVLCFGNYIYRGSRASKTHSDDFQAYDSPNFRYLGHIGVDINLNKYLINRKNSKRLETLKSYKTKKIFTFTVLPEHNAVYLEHLCKIKLDALIIDGYGVGNIPSDTAFINAIKKLSKRGTLIIANTQCLFGRVDLSTYETGRLLKETGIIEASDMTLEAIYAKACYLLNRYKDRATIIKKFQDNLVGELTPKSSVVHDSFSNLIPALWSS